MMSFSAVSRRSAVSVIEIMVVVVLASLIMGTANLIFSRTRVTFHNAASMIEVQLLADIILNCLQKDLNNMVDVSECAENRLSFRCSNREGNLVPVTYEYFPAERTLYRNDPVGRSDFKGAGLVEGLGFRGLAEDNRPLLQPDHPADFCFLVVALQVKTEKRPTDIGESRVSIVRSFYPRSLGNPYWR